MTGSKHRGRPATRAIVISMVVGLAVAATAGIAGGKLKEKSATVDLAPEETGTATARCDKGTRAVAGGFDDPTFNPDAPPGSYAATFRSRRASKREWTSTFTNGFILDSATAFTYAYCSDDLPKLKVVSKTVAVAEDSVESVAARCPRGGEAISGGFDGEQIAAYDGVFPYGSRRAGKRKWVATGYASPGADLTVYAYCAKHKLGLKSRSATAGPPIGDNASAEARCHKGERVISGGFDSDLDDGLFADPYESRRTGRRRWTASTAAYQDFEFTAFAYCLEKEKR